MTGQEIGQFSTKAIGRGWAFGGLEPGTGPVYAFKSDGPVIGPLGNIFDAILSAMWYEEEIEPVVIVGQLDLFTGQFGQ